MSQSVQSDCPIPETLSDFEHGLLSEAELIRVAEHLEHCERCLQIIAGRSSQDSDLLIRGLRQFIPADQFQPNLNSPIAPTVGQTGLFVVPATGTIDYVPGLASDQDIPIPSPSDPSDDRNGSEEMFGHYRLLKTLGAGGMGIVYKAMDTRLKRIVALKMIKSSLASQEGYDRFLAEAQAVARLQHPNVVQVFEVGEIAGQPYCTLEYISGGSLDHRDKGTVLSPAGAATLVEQLSRGMQAVHDLKLIHRDLKPANVLLQGAQEVPLEECIPKVTDFGLVKFLDDQSDGQTHADAIMGTPSFMAPEQAAGKTRDVTPAADIYALGATLYDLLCDRPPFKGETLTETLRQVREDPPLAPRSLRPR